jgi:C_GCAxxG_C_C family probable redox protein
MDAPILTKEELAARFSAGGLCSQCTLEPWADALGYDVEELRRMSAAFGGGMFRGDTCGGVTGALMAIGLAFGDDVELTKQKTAEFQAAFIERFGTTICRELLGYDLSRPGELEKARESGKMIDVCAVVVRAASEILREMLRDVD